MKRPIFPLRAAGVAAIVAAVLLAAVSAYRIGCVSRDKKGVPSVNVRQNILVERRSRLITCAARIGDCSPDAFQRLEMPAEDVFRVMDTNERRVLATAADRVLDRVLSTNECSGALMQWEICALALLKADGGEASAAVIRRVQDVPLHQISSLEKLGQAESLMRTVYPAMVSRGEAEPSSFDRSPIKKAIIRRQIYLLKGANSK